MCWRECLRDPIGAAMRLSAYAGGPLKSRGPDGHDSGGSPTIGFTPPDYHGTTACGNTPNDLP